MMRACALGFFGLCAAIAAAQEPAIDPAKVASKGQKGEVVPAPFRAYIAVDDHVPANINDHVKATEVFLEAIKIRDRTDRRKFLTSKTAEFEAGVAKIEKDATVVAKLTREFQTSLDEWFTAYTARNHDDSMHDPICEYGLNPYVAIFVRVREDAKQLTATSGVSKLASELNKLVTDPNPNAADYRGSKFSTVVFFLKLEGMQKSVTVTNPDKSQSTVELDAEYPDDEKRDIPYANDIRALAKEIKAPNVVYGLAPATSKAAAAWGIDAADEVTVVFVNRIRVIDRWKFKAADGPTDAEIKTIIGTVESSVLGKKP